MKLKRIHKKNFELINKYGLIKGYILKLKKDYGYFKKGNKFKIKLIHSLYGWVLFEETEQLPQEIKELEKIMDLKTIKKRVKEILRKEGLKENGKQFL